MNNRAGFGRRIAKQTHGRAGLCPFFREPELPGQDRAPRLAQHRAEPGALRAPRRVVAAVLHRIAIALGRAGALAVAAARARNIIVPRISRSLSCGRFHGRQYAPARAAFDKRELFRLTRWRAGAFSAALPAPLAAPAAAERPLLGVVAGRLGRL